MMNIFPNDYYSDNCYNKNNILSIKSNLEMYKDNVINRNYLKNRKFMSLKNLTFSNNLNEEKKQFENNNIKFPSFDNNNINNNVNNKVNSSIKNSKNMKNYSAAPKKRIKLKKNVIDKYITKMAQLSNENVVNYNSGCFKIPLIGLNAK